jgi:hypothetical protein
MNIIFGLSGLEHEETIHKNALSKKNKFTVPDIFIFDVREMVKDKSNILALKPSKYEYYFFANDYDKKIKQLDTRE